MNLFNFDCFQLLWERFKEFARETQSVGSERVATAERIADQMIAMGHSDNATIAQWKEGLRETWQDLLELIDTRTQVRKYQTDSGSDSLSGI